MTTIHESELGCSAKSGNPGRPHKLPLNTWSATTTAAIAGMVEGDGYIGAKKSRGGDPLVRLRLTDEDIVTDFAQLWDTKVGKRHDRYHLDRIAARGHKQQYETCVTGYNAAEVILRIFPLLSDHRAAQAINALESWKSFTGQVPSEHKVGGTGTLSNPETRAWLAGLLDAEGHFRWRHTPVVQCSSNDLDVITRVADLMGVNYRGNKDPRYTAIQYKAEAYGSNALRVCEAIYPHMYSRKRAVIDHIFNMVADHPVIQPEQPKPNPWLVG